MRKNENIRVNVQRDVKDWLEWQAAARRCSVSQVVLELVLQAMSRGDKADKEAQ